ncbi:MAG TPA: DinB family protein [Armatimonadota bacterium]|jgi:hypothetical protein
MDVRGALKREYHGSLAMLRQAIERCPEEVWVSGDHPRNYWRIAYHALFFAHFYLQPNADAFTRWEGHRPDTHSLSDGPWLPNGTPEVVEPYTKQELLDYLTLCDAMIDEGVDRIDLDAQECGFPWYQMPKLDHQIVNIRHIQQHVGQMAELLMAHGVEVDWVG